MATTYEPIATYTAGSGQTSYTFSSIAATYTDLVFVINGTANPAQNLSLQFNGDTGSNYSATYMDGNGSSASSGRVSSQTNALVGAMYSGQGVNIFSIMNYSNSTTYKTVISRSSYAGSVVASYVSLWRSTAAINSVKINNSFDTGTVITLYGIKAA